MVLENAIVLIAGNRRETLCIPGCAPATLWCAMDEKSSAFFSHIGEDSALLCLNRAVSLPGGVLEPQERRVPYERGRTVEENLLSAVKQTITQAAGGGEGSG